MVAVGDSVVVQVGDGVVVAVGEGLPDGLLEHVQLGETLQLAVGLLLVVGLLVGDRVVVPVALLVWDIEGVGEGLPEGVAVDVAVPVGLRVIKAGWIMSRLTGP